jgi:hypothetical protein
MIREKRGGVGILNPRADPVLPHYAAGRMWMIAWRIAMMMLRNTDQSNMVMLTSFAVIR